MEKLIPLARPSLSDAERSAAQRVLSGTMLTGGAERVRFEAAVATAASREHAVATSSGTTALQLALWAMEVGPGDSVLVTAFGFPAAANVVASMGARPVAVDVQLDSWLVDMERARSLVEPSTKALVTIDQLGAVTSSEAIDAFEEQSEIAVISDAACGFGGTDANGMVAGRGGSMATFSFHPRKVVTTGEGGAVVCNDEELALRLRQLGNHGQAGGGAFARIGTNARLDEVASAIGLAQLARLEPMLAERRMIVSGYHERLESLRSAGRLSWQVLSGEAKHANQSFSLLLHEQSERSLVIEHLTSKGIGCGPATYSFAEIGTHPNCGQAPNAALLHKQAISLPLYIGMRSAELDRVCDALSEAIQ